MRRRDLVPRSSDLGFVAQPQVRWLDPPELARTALKVVLASVFTTYGDRREVQAALPGGLVEPAHRPDGDLWLDFVADLGDGFDATYTVATLLAQPELKVAGPGGPLALPRGHVLVMGGDEVYPAASARGYEHRTTGPYGAALPAPRPGAVLDATTEPTLLAIPGNHDWYDGLTAWLRVFTRGASVGAWRTVQRRSYFALRLAPGWWLLGLDSQLDEYIDEPQLDYFRTHVTAHLRPGDAVVVCAAEPAWAKAGHDPDAFNQLHFFEREVVRYRQVPGRREREDTGARVRLWLSGDQHVYSRYASRAPGTVGPAGAAGTVGSVGSVGSVDAVDPRAVQAVTCGLGGAYLGDTDQLVDHLVLPPPASRMRTKDTPGTPFDRVGPTHPAQDVSRRLRRRIANPLSPFWAGRRNVGLLATAGVVQLLVVGCLAGLLGVLRGGSPTLLRGPSADVAAAAAGAAAWVLGLLLLHAVVATVMPDGRLARLVPATTGIGLQLVAALVVLVAAVAVPWPTWSPALTATLVVPFVVVLGALLGTQAFALLLLSRRTGVVAGWQMSGQAVTDHKGFLRLCLRTDGRLEIYPLVVDTVCRRWDVDTRDGAPRPVPADGLPAVRLLEGPIVVAQEGFTS
ncbi:hypothetical protein GXP71_03285 [Cellulomonas sp. H30R-01]|uniref:hypothetical protein n=1 Tax=Cellulomonas sp. H30R-01 TaxID=2704467 RepID=UPI00138D95B2|nr:hypothetical protein [Cellulomonas sp. H30R-01]QHT55204.1 hypothetical protein GXP71_03285 [Cellulomonas sp. H30R-01]